MATADNRQPASRGDDVKSAGTTYRSSNWFEGDGLDGFLHRSWLKSEGFSDETIQRKPLIGICNSWSELVNCNSHLRELAEAVRRGVMQAGGFPLEFPVLSLGEALMKPTTMLYRNLMAMDVEESIRSYPLDGVVLLTGCDKTTPASIMGLASSNVPGIVITGGPMLSGHWQGREIGSCSDCWQFHEDVRAGRLDKVEFRKIENAMCRSHGHCMTMGTASTMACITEGLGLTLPNGAALPAVDSRRSHLAEEAGRKIVDLVERDIRPADILTREAFENAIRVLHAIGGSTNGVIHLLACARRVGVDLTLQLFDDLSETTPWLVNLKPSGEFLMEDFCYAGGVPAVMNEISDRLHLTAMTVTGKSLGENIEGAKSENSAVIASSDTPLLGHGALAALRGTLCPDGAVIKVAAADSRLLEHEGRAVVFDGIHDLASRVDDPDLDIDESCVMVLRNGGPIGAPGMPEWGHLPIPAKLLKRGVTDIVRISDARMSGTSYGTIVLHVSPEAAIGGPLALVQDGDRIRLDVRSRTLDLLVDEAELERRRAAWVPPDFSHDRGYLRLNRQNVLQAQDGCDFACFEGSSPVVSDALTHL
jgi:L-arabonate dehydrase